MKSKNFVQPPSDHAENKKTTDYWGMLFIGIIFLSSMSCFLFANHSDRQVSNNLSFSNYSTIIDTGQSSQS